MERAYERQPMDSIIPIIVLLVLGVPAALAVWLIVRAVSAGNRIAELTNRLSDLELEVIRLRRQQESPQPAAAKPTPAPQPAGVTPPVTVAPVLSSAATLAATFDVPPATREAAPASPWGLPTSAPTPEPVIPQKPEPEWSAPEETEPEVITPPRPEPVFAPSGPPVPAINWEQFMGVKGFAWIGGFALFLGVAFFIKYSFDNNLVPPELRVAIGFLTGLGLLVGGVWMARQQAQTLAQTLCATGIVILYAVTFACRSIYHFEFFGPIPTFLLMVLITTTAFLVAVRLDALVVAILGMLGGFLTPVLLSTGQDNPLGLFGYLAILDVGLVVVALNRRWYFLTALAAAATGLMQVGWVDKFFVPEQYFAGDKIFTALGVLLGFNLLYLAASWWAKQREQTNAWLSGATLGLVAVAVGLTASFLDFPTLAHRPWLMFSFLFLLDVVAIALTLLDARMTVAQSVAGVAIFGVLGWWTSNFLTNELLNAALAFYFLFAVLHAVLPVALKRWRGAAAQPWVTHLFPILALVLVLVPLFQLPVVSFLVWPFILLVDLLAILLAVGSATLLPVLAVLALTLGATALLIFKIPATLTGLAPAFFLLGAFVVFFVLVTVWLVKRFCPGALVTGLTFGSNPADPAGVAALLPGCSIVLPFLLLIMATSRLMVEDPSPVFGLALLLVVLLFGMTWLFSLDWLPAVGLVCVAALEAAWHVRFFDLADGGMPVTLVLVWYLIFYAAFTLFPFLFLRRYQDRVGPWAVAALAGVPQFILIHRWVAAVYPNHFMGLLPAAFAVPALLGLVVVLKRIPATSPARLAQLAWFGGVALLFISLIFPIQFDRQWLTIGWALEGAALLWLFHRVPHAGLRLVGTGLLVAAFVRLACNPTVLDYPPRAATPIFNWYLYAYGSVAVCLFAGTKLLAPPRERVAALNVPPLFAALGTVLLFLLLNIEISDYFSAPGETLTFQFSDNFARDMSCSIGWALFALALLVYGIGKQSAAARYAAMALLCVTLLKLFLHDLDQLGPLYRIGAFIGVAIIAMLASLAYQKFFAGSLKAKDAPP